MKKTKNIPKQLQAVGYVRVSSALQRDEGVSIQAQKEKIKQWAADNNAQLISIYEDNGISGKNTNGRPGFQKAMETVLHHKAVMVCYSLSRLSRSMKDMIAIGSTLGEAGCQLVSLTEKIDTTTAAGKMIFNMLSVLGQFQVDLISELTKAGLAHVRKSGKKTGGRCPYGYDVKEDGRTLYHNPQEQKVIKKITKLYSSGVSYGSIAKTLNIEGIPTKLSHKWQTQTVKNVVLANNQNDKS